MTTTDKILDAVGAQEIQSYAIRTYRLWAWIVMREQLDYPDKVIARLTAGTPTSCVLVADVLEELQAQLPTGLVRSGRQPADPQGVVEFWFPA